jgi:hypothetical protein
MTDLTAPAQYAEYLSQTADATAAFAVIIVGVTLLTLYLMAFLLFINRWNQIR